MAEELPAGVMGRRNYQPTKFDATKTDRYGFVRSRKRTMRIVFAIVDREADFSVELPYTTIRNTQTKTPNCRRSH